MWRFYFEKGGECGECCEYSSAALLQFNLKLIL